MSCVSDCRIGGVDSDVNRLEDWVTRFQLTMPEWHRGIVWPAEVQQRYVESWLKGDIALTLHMGQIGTKVNEMDHPWVFIDGANGLHSIRLAQLGRLEIPDFEVRAKKVPWHSRMFHCERYRGTAEQLAYVTYILNRGSPCPWDKQTLNALK